jgi:hypothetical protein
VTEAASLLHLLKAEPTLLRPVVGSEDPVQQMYHRAQDEIHPCLRCGHRAAQALIAETRVGARWLDLCMDCVVWLCSASTAGELDDGPAGGPRDQS